MSADYQTRADAATATYTATYAKWVASQSPAMRRKLHAMGLDKPKADSQASGAPFDRDGENAAPEAKVAPPAIRENLCDELCERFGVTVEQGQRIAQWIGAEVERESLRHKAFVIGRIIGWLIRPGNTRLRCTGLAFAAGLDALNGLGTMTEAAGPLRVTRAAVSKAANEAADLLELPRLGTMKSDAARKRYSQDKKQHHWRKKSCPTP